MRISSWELSDRGHLQILYCHSQLWMGEDEIEILIFFVYVSNYLENMKALPLTVLSNKSPLVPYITRLGIWFWEQTVWGLPYASPVYPSVFHLPLFPGRDTSTGVRALGQVVWCLLAALASHCVAYTCLLAPILLHIRKDLLIRSSHFW